MFHPVLVLRHIVSPEFTCSLNFFACTWCFRVLDKVEDLVCVQCCRCAQSLSGLHSMALASLRVSVTSFQLQHSPCGAGKLLTFLGEAACTASYPCEICTGDCNEDSDCRGDLMSPAPAAAAAVKLIFCVVAAVSNETTWRPYQDAVVAVWAITTVRITATLSMFHSSSLRSSKCSKQLTG